MVKRNKKELLLLIIWVTTALIFLGFGLWYWLTILSTGSNVLVDSTVCTASDGWFRFAFLNMTLQALSAFVASYGIMHSIILLSYWIFTCLLHKENFLIKTIRVLLSMILFAFAALVIYIFVSTLLRTVTGGGFAKFLVIFFGIIGGILITLPIFDFAIEKNYVKAMIIIAILSACIFVIFFVFGSFLWATTTMPFLGLIFFFILLCVLGGSAYTEIRFTINGELFTIRIYD